MRIVFVTPQPPSRARARSLGFILELARRHSVTAIALCQTPADAATLHRLRALGVETIAIPDRLASGGRPTEDSLARMRQTLTRVVARGDVGAIQIEGARLASVARNLQVPVIWDVVSEEVIAHRALPPATRGDQSRMSLTQYAAVIVGSERDAMSLLSVNRQPSAPLSARLADLGAPVESIESIESILPDPQGDDIALRSFPLLRRRSANGGAKRRGKAQDERGSWPDNEQGEERDQERIAPTPIPLSFAGRPPRGRALGVRVIPEAIDVAYYAPQAEERGRVGLVVYADLADEAMIQGIAWVLREAAPRIWRIRPQVNLTIVGRGGSARPPDAFADTQAQLHDDRVRLVEGVADTRAIIRQAALVIVPTLDVPGEARRRTHECALEAMALGAPTVVTQAEFAGLMAAPGRDLLVATSAERLATLTLRVLGDEDLWRMLARHGRAYVVRRHSWRVANQQLDRLYAHALGYPTTTAPVDLVEPDANTESVGALGALDQAATSASLLAAPETPGERALADAVSVMSMLGLVGLATNPLAGAPSSGRLAPRWR